MTINISGYNILIDDEDFEKVNALKWHHGDNKRKAVYFYHSVRKPKRRNILLHRFILNAPNGIEVDHINLNTLDNRKSNLRLCTHIQNTYNRPSWRKNKTGFKGVYKRGNKYQAQIQFERKKRCLGYFHTPEKAYVAYCKAAKKYHGEFARAE